VFDGVRRSLADRENQVVPSLRGESELPEELAGFSANGRELTRVSRPRLMYEL